jgi:response regulator RpfG family c-di-GMP phosphodiesterase
VSRSAGGNATGIGIGDVFGQSDRRKCHHVFPSGLNVSYAFILYQSTLADMKPSDPIITASDPVIIALSRYTQALAVALGYRDISTRLHSERVNGLAAEIGLRCGLKSRALDVLQIGSTFHDVGKIGIPDRILFSTSALSEDDCERVRRHPIIGEEILLALNLDGAEEAAKIIRHHHENFDGTGYPDNLSGDMIPYLSRIIGIADSYDAMATKRSYHRAMNHGEIMAVLVSETGKKHDPEIMKAFHTVIEDSGFKA